MNANRSNDPDFGALVYFDNHGYIQGDIKGVTNKNGVLPYGANLVVFEKMGYIKGNVTGEEINAYNNSNYLVFKDNAKIEGNVDTAKNSILLGTVNKTLTITGGINGETKIWGTKTALTAYSDEDTLKSSVTTFFKTNPSR